jgi:hypothetical protein
MIAGLICSYDECLTDDDCHKAHPSMKHPICQCRPDATSLAVNTCIDGGCAVDADCPAPGYCSPLPDQGCGVTSYQCRTLTDQCVEDSDCTAGGQKGYCTGSPQVGGWSCSYAGCGMSG